MLHVGDKLDNLYEIQEEIGSGGGGIIYKAYHLRLKKPVVIKLIKEQVKSKINERAEADILKGIKHAYLPQVYDFVSDGEDIYTVIDYIPGDSFDHLLKKQEHFSQPQVVKWGGQLCEALVYLHTHHPPIIHSDIKPANVMLTTDENICLIDFNISLIFDEENANAVGFSEGYSAPELGRRIKSVSGRSGAEQTEIIKEVPPTEVLDEAYATEILNTVETGARLEATQLMMDHEAPAGGTALLLQGQEKTAHRLLALPEEEKGVSATPLVFQKGSRIDERSDIYSLGATLYHLATGRKPASGRCIWDEKLKIGDGVQYIIEKAMAPLPEDRFQSANEMLHAIHNIHRLDGKYRRQVVQQWAVSIILSIFLAGFMITSKIGWDLMRGEKRSAYEELILQGDRLSGQQLFIEASAAAQEAQALFPDLPGGYKAQALVLFRQREWEECLDYLEKTILRFSEFERQDEMDDLADLYFIQANVFFEQEQYEQAIPAYQSAIEKNQSNNEYYRDYAISQARLGQTEEAQAILETAIALQLDTASVLLVQGELALAEQDYLLAEKSFLSAIQKAESEYTMERGYLVCAQTYERGGEVFPDGLDSEIRLLEEGVHRLPADKNMSLKEKLGKAYASKAQRTGDMLSYEKAVQCFTALLDSGYSRFYVMNNLVILYQGMGDFGSAEEMLQKMEKRFPEDYRVYMQMAFLYAEIEAQKPVAARDYSRVADAYEKSRDLYREHREQNATDPQMQMLEGMVGELRDGGWIL